jgi:hypothetical protein
LCGFFKLCGSCICQPTLDDNDNLVRGCFE